MKIFIGKPRSYWISPYSIIEFVVFWREVDYDDPLVVKWNDYLEPISRAIQYVGQKFDPRSKSVIKVDPWDTWGMDTTLSVIILPMLRQLQATKHGAPFVNDEDVPEHLRSTSAPPKQDEYDVDQNHFARWDWVLDEMIWTFEQLQPRADWESKYYDSSYHLSDPEGYEQHEKRIEKGLYLFGRYFQALWD